MKNIKRIIMLMCVILVGISCKKETGKVVPLSSVNVINAAVNLGAVKVNYFNKPIIYATYPTQVNYAANGVYNLPVGNPSLTIVPTADTLHPVFNNAINTENGASYSLYLIGQTPVTETLLMKDNLPHYADSTVGVRFINLSPNSPAVNINISATPATIEFQNLAYKQITDFKAYPALKANGTYVFQIRNAATNALLATYTLTTPRFFGVTLVLRGLVGSSPSFGVTRVNNY